MVGHGRMFDLRSATSNDMYEFGPEDITYLKLASSFWVHFGSYKSGS